MTLVRYILKEILIPLVVWIGFLFLLLIVMQFLRGSELLLGSSVTALDLGEVLIYLAPHFLMLAVPIALLLAILLGYGRLNEDRELLAMSSVGVSSAQLVVMPTLLGVALAGLLVLITFTAQPWGLSQLKARANDLIRKNLVGEVRSGTFYEDLSGLTLYVETVDPEGGKWSNVLIHDDRDPSAPLMVLANRGVVHPGGRGEALRFSLAEGEVHRSGVFSPDYSVVNFERGELAVAVEQYVRRKNRFPATPKEELTPGELFEAAETIEAQGGDPNPYWMAFHWRIGRALAPIPFGVLGAALGLSRRNSGKARGFLLTLLGYVAYYVVGRAFENWGNLGQVPHLLAGQVANVVFLLVGVVYLVRLNREGSVR